MLITQKLIYYTEFYFPIIKICDMQYFRFVLYLHDYNELKIIQIFIGRVWLLLVVQVLIWLDWTSVEYPDSSPTLVSSSHTIRADNLQVLPFYNLFQRVWRHLLMAKMVFFFIKICSWTLNIIIKKRNSMFIFNIRK